MFEQHLAAEAKDDCIEFLELYARFKQDIADPAADKLRIARFAAKIDVAWHKIPETKRAALVQALLIDKLLPEVIGEAIRTLKAKVVRIV